MRIWGTISLLLLASVTLFARKEDSLDTLKARVASATPEQSVGLCLEIAERQLIAADKLYTDGNVDQARAAVDDVVAYSEKARDAATQTGKKLKNSEISVRKMATKLRDMKRTLNFEDQPPVQEAIDHLERVRSDLLARMFGNGKEK
jgi:polyhydroxyalkanoate synthesis regulator phasin